MLEDEQSKIANQLENISFHSIMHTHTDTHTQRTTITQKRTKEAKCSDILKKLCSNLFEFRVMQIY